MTAKYFPATHSFIWAHTDERRMSVQVRKIIRNADMHIARSVVSLWEIVVKYTLGKLPLLLTSQRLSDRIVDESV